MFFTVSRTSDQFMTCELPNPEWPPHKEANWDAKLKNWTLNVGSLEELISLVNKKDVQLLVSKEKDSVPHVELDDVTFSQIPS